MRTNLAVSETLVPLATALDVRLAARSGALDAPTAGLAYGEVSSSVAGRWKITTVVPDEPFFDVEDSAGARRRTIHAAPSSIGCRVPRPARSRPR